MQSNGDINVSTRPGRSVMSRCSRLVMDNANIFKAFIGTNFLSASFALSMSGLYLGIAGLVVIATVTVHCCHLIVKCKKSVIHNIITRFDLHPKSSVQHASLVESIEKSMSYGDVARLRLGKWGIWITNFSLIITQFGFCTNYFIFIGNTIQRMFPFHNATSHHDSNSTFISDTTNSVFNETTQYSTETPTTFPSWSDVADNASVSMAPRYELLMLIPFPIFLGFAYLRKIRQLGSSSLIANASMIVAYCAVMYYVLKDFEIHDGIEEVKWATFPVFFGQIVGAYEGIGTIIPIESSMEENRHLYPLLLRLNVLFFTLLMASIGIVGYLYFGSDIEQMIIWNLPNNAPLTLAVSTTLLIGIVFTYPLQVFPIIEIMEQITFGPGQCLGPPLDKGESIVRENERDDDEYPIHSQETTSLIRPDRDPDDEMMKETFKECVVTVTIPDSVATWKRNVLRTLVVVCQAGLALVLKDDIAYFGAFTGAIGSTILGFILPCIIHLKLKGKVLNPFIWAKDIFIMIFGVAGGISGVYVSIMSIINNNK